VPRILGADVCARSRRWWGWSRICFDLSQVDAAAFRTDARSIAVADAVRHAVELCDHDARAKSIGVHTDLTSAADARCSAKLARVLDSLVDNAVRYTPTGGSVTVTATTVNGALELSVQDSGVGLTGGQRDRVVRAVLEGRRFALDERLRPRTDARPAHHPRTRGRDPRSQRTGWGSLFRVVIPDDRSLRGSGVAGGRPQLVHQLLGVKGLASA